MPDVPDRSVPEEGWASTGDVPAPGAGQHTEGEAVARREQPEHPEHPERQGTGAAGGAAVDASRPPLERAPPPLVLHEWRSLDPGWVPAERVGWWILVAIVLPTAATSAAIFWARAWWQFALLGALLLLGLPTSVALGTRWARRQYAHASWRVTGQGLELRRGVWWRREVHVPRTRVQHIDVMQGPVQRRFGISTLTVHTAGTEHATVSLDGLSRAAAEGVREHLLAAERRDDV